MCFKLDGKNLSLSLSHKRFVDTTISTLIGSLRSRRTFLSTWPPLPSNTNIHVYVKTFYFEIHRWMTIYVNNLSLTKMSPVQLDLNIRGTYFN